VLKLDILVQFLSPEVDESLNPLSLKSKMADSAQIGHYFNRSNSAADCSISLKFGAELDHVTADTLQTF